MYKRPIQTLTKSNSTFQYDEMLVCFITFWYPESFGMMFKRTVILTLMTMRHFFQDCNGWRKLPLVRSHVEPSTYCRYIKLDCTTPAEYQESVIGSAKTTDECRHLVPRRRDRVCVSLRHDIVTGIVPTTTRPPGSVGVHTSTNAAPIMRHVVSIGIIRKWGEAG